MVGVDEEWVLEGMVCHASILRFPSRNQIVFLPIHMIVDINWASVLGLLVVYGVVIYLFIVCVCR